MSSIFSLNKQEPLSKDKLDYLAGKYIFRYPFAFSSIRWGLTLGAFFGIHSYVRTKNLRDAMISFIEKTTYFSFAIFAYFFTKYNFYQTSIQGYQDDEDQRVREMEFMKRYLSFKLKLPSKHNLNEEEIFKKHERYMKEQVKKSEKLNIMLLRVNDKTFDIC